MDKLNKLLEEYPNGKGDIDSLKFLRGFIKWLVENDKINISNYEYEIGAARIGENNIDEWRDEYSDYEKTLMLLSIQDEPIEFLISVLK